MLHFDLRIHPRQRHYNLAGRANCVADTYSIIDDPKMAKSLSDLLAQASIEDHDETLRAANAEIKKNRSNTDAQYAKAIALLHLDDFEGALKVFEDVKELQRKAQFEYAYALYKTGDAAKAVEIAQASSAKSDRKTQHILAQAVCAPGTLCIG